MLEEASKIKERTKQAFKTDYVKFDELEETKMGDANKIKSGSLMPTGPLGFAIEELPQQLRPNEIISYIKSEEDLRQIKNKELREFYEEQNEFIDFVVETLGREEDKEASAGRRASTSAASNDHPNRFLRKQLSVNHVLASPRLASFAINLSFYTNVLLTILKLFALISSGSMAVLASLADSFLDLLSGAVLFFSKRAAGRADRYEYPGGRRRLEPLGVVVFAAVMGVSSLQIVSEAARRLGQGASGDVVAISFQPFVQAVVGVTVGSKLLLALFCYRAAAATGSSAVEAYAQDHRNDVVTNSFGVVGLWLAVRYPKLWPLDPLAAIVIALWIIWNWAVTAYEVTDQLVGRSARPALLRRLTLLALTHDARVVMVDTVRAYHFGEGFLVEADLALPPGMPLREAHDIGESLQIKLEQLEEVERAFVHLDYEWTHKPEHDRDDLV